MTPNRYSTLNISETIRDRHVVTTDKVICGLLSCATAIANDLDCSLMYFSYLLFQLFRSENNCSLLFRPLIKSPGIRRRMTLPMIFRPGTRWQQNLIRQNRIRLCGLRQCRVFVALLSKVDCRRLVRLCRTTVERRLTWIFMSHVMIQPLVTSFVSPKRTNWREVECGSLLWCRQWC